MSRHQSHNHIAIISAARTPCGCFNGSLKAVDATTLGATAIKKCLRNVNINSEYIDEVIMGCVLPAGLGQAPARQAALQAGLLASTGCTTINKVCGSGMKATMLAHDIITVNGQGLVLAGGMESMSNAPQLIAADKTLPIDDRRDVKRHLFLDGLQDAETGDLMGQYAQNMADQAGYTRQQLDAFALKSLTRANQAIANGNFHDETAPVNVETDQGEVTIYHDEQPRLADPEKIPQLQPAFKENGTITAANSSSISDGASALLLTDTESALAQGITPLATIVGHTTHSQHPSLFTTAPISAINKLLEKVGWQKEQVDLWEINEAFALITLLAVDALQLDIERVNINGGACALGHPLGSSGSRIIVSLIYALRARNLKRGIASLCIGGGEATAIAIEVI